MVCLVACAGSPPRDAAPSPLGVRLCRSDQQCRADEACAPLTGDRRACTSTALLDEVAGWEVTGGPRGEAPPPAIAWSGPQRLISRGTAAAAAGLGQRAGALTVTGTVRRVWQVAAGGQIDGLAAGDFESDNVAEIVALLRSPGGKTGAIKAFRADGTLRWTYNVPVKVAGAPTVIDVDGDGDDEVAFCESEVNGMCRVLDGNGALLRSVGPFYIPALSGMAPAAADLNGDGAEDLIIPTYGGVVVAINGRTGAELWRYDAYNSGTPPYHEQFWGHPAVADIDADGTLEVVLGGANFGGLFVLNARTGAPRFVLADLWTSHDNYFLGNGAALVDLDANSDTREIVVSMLGEPPAVVAFTVTGQELWRAPAAGDDFAWLTPIGLDSDNDGDLDLAVQTRNRGLRIVDRAGRTVLSKTSGEAWSSPSGINADSDADIDLIASTTASLMVLDARTLAEIGRLDAGAGEGGLSPAALVVDVDGNGVVDIITASFNASQLIRARLATRSSVGWYASLGGDRAHTHSSPGGCAVGGAKPTREGGLWVALLVGAWWLRRARRRPLVSRGAASLLLLAGALLLGACAGGGSTTVPPDGQAGRTDGQPARVPDRGLASDLGGAPVADAAPALNDGDAVAGDGDAGPRCGNGRREAIESCDDGNGRNLDGCDANCLFEQTLRLNSLRVQFGTDDFCTANALGRAFTLAIREQVQHAWDLDVAAGRVNLLLHFVALADPRGGRPGPVEVGFLAAAPVLGDGYDGLADLDWWYTVEPASLSTSRLPLLRVAGELRDGRLELGPGTVPLPLSFSGLAGAALSRLELVDARVIGTVGPASAPLAAAEGPRGHRPDERLDPTLESFAALSERGLDAGTLCGKLSAAALAQTPAPALLAGSGFCSPDYPANATLLDVIVGGCNSAVFGLLLRATQPDDDVLSVSAAGQGPPYQLGLQQGRVQSCLDHEGAAVELGACLRDAAWSAHFRFTAGRVIAR